MGRYDNSFPTQCSDKDLDGFGVAEVGMIFVSACKFISRCRFGGLWGCSQPLGQRFQLALVAGGRCPDEVAARNEMGVLPWLRACLPRPAAPDA